MPDKNVSFRSYWSLQFAVIGPPPTQRISQPVGAVLAYAAMVLGLSPSTVSILALASSVAGACVFALGPQTLVVGLACLLLYQLGYALDCADGQLARATSRTSDYGAWLDVSCDHARNAAVCVAAGWAMTRGGPATLGFGDVLVAVGALLAGLTLSLHTSTELRRRGLANERPFVGAAHILRVGVSTVMDTPVFLLGLCLARAYPQALWTYAVVMGAGYALLAWAIASRRLAGTSRRAA